MKTKTQTKKEEWLGQMARGHTTKKASDSQKEPQVKRMLPRQPMRRKLFFCTPCDMETEHYAAEGYWNCHACGSSITNAPEAPNRTQIRETIWEKGARRNREVEAARDKQEFNYKRNAELCDRLRKASGHFAEHHKIHPVDCYNAFLAAANIQEEYDKPSIEEGATLGALIEKHAQEQHSPLPWHYGQARIWTDSGEIIASLIGHGSNARNNHGKLIVRAVNNAEALAEALEQFVRYADNGKHPEWANYMLTIAGDKMRAALNAWRAGE